MGYLIVKGRRSHQVRNGDIISIMEHAGDGDSRWVTRQRGAKAEPGDRCLMWSSSPDLAFVGAAVVHRTYRRGDSFFFVLRFVSKSFPKPWLGAAELRQQPELKDSVFLKSGPAFTIFHISPVEANTILRMLRERHGEAALGDAARWHDTPFSRPEGAREDAGPDDDPPNADGDDDVEYLELFMEPGWGWTFYQDGAGNYFRARYPDGDVTKEDVEPMAPRVDCQSAVEREKGWLYFVDQDGNVARIPTRAKKSQPQVVLKTGIKRDPVRIYILDAQGRACSFGLEPPSPTAVPAAPEGHTMSALSVRQPYAEQIMRGMKLEEYRSVQTHKRERVYIYASETPGDPGAFASLGVAPGGLPTGVVVGSVEIVDCVGEDGAYAWQLANPVRLETPRKPEGRPQPVFFIPWK